MKKFFFLIFFLLVFFPHPVSATDFTVTDAANLQSTADQTKDGDAIIISGKLSGAIFNPYEGGRSGINSCFVNLKGKSLTLKGGVLFGDGHDIGRPPETAPGNEASPYYHRAGICTNGGKITIDGVRVKEFEGGGMLLTNTQLVLKNSSVEGNDHGGIFLNNSSILAIDNYFISNIGIMPSGNANIQAYNNTFYSSKSIYMSCNDVVPPITFKNNIVVDPENVLGFSGSCPQKLTEIDKNKFSHNLFWMSLSKDNLNPRTTCYDSEYCVDFPGRIFADPLIGNGYDASVGPGGLDIGTLDLRPESPAVNAGDSSIPGGKNLGPSGGPCADPGQSICSQFIAAHQPPVPPGEQPPGPGPNPNPSPGNTTIISQLNLFPQIVNPYSLADVIGQVINVPDNLFTSFRKPISWIGMDLFLYVIFSATYIMFIHFAIGIKDEFKIFGMLGYFIAGGIIGAWFQNYEAGFVVGVILSLIFF